MNGRKDLIVRAEWYRVFQFLTVTTAAIYTTGLAFWVTNPIINKLFPVVVCVCLMWGLFYLLQLMPSFGYYIIIIEKMIGTLMNFELIFWFLFLPFSVGFYILLKEELDCTTSKEFSGFGYSLHSTVLIMLNMFDLSTYVERMDYGWLLGFFHFFFFLVVVVMALNFLIALFSYSVSEISKHSRLIMPVQRLSIICVLEWRCRRFLGRYYRRKLRSCGCYVFENDRIYLQTIESIYEAW